MRDLVKLLSVITGLFRSIVTILCLFGAVFIALVNTSLLMAFLDIIGFSELSPAFIKPIFIVSFTLLFIINFIITRHIFKAGDDGRFHLSNFIFSILFLSLTAFIYFTFKRNMATNTIYVVFALNGLLAFNSLLGLIAKARGVYKEEEVIVREEPVKRQDYIEFKPQRDEDDREVLVFERDVVLEDDTYDGAHLTAPIVVDKVIEESKKSSPEETQATQSETKVIEKPVLKPVDKEVTQAIDKGKVLESSEEKIELKKNQKLVFGAKDDSSYKNINKSPENNAIIKEENVSKEPKVETSTPKEKQVKKDLAKKTPTNRLAKKKEDKPVEKKDDKKEVLINKQTNSISYQSSTLSDKETYGDDESQIIAEEKNNRKYDKSRFTQKSNNSENDSLN